MNNKKERQCQPRNSGKNIDPGLIKKAGGNVAVIRSEMYKIRTGTLKPCEAINNVFQTAFSPVCEYKLKNPQVRT